MKKHFMKKFLPALLCLSMLAGLVVSASAAGKADIVFDAAKETFTIGGQTITKDGKQEKPYPDLFPSMKDMMPGDKVEQTITVQVKNAGKNTVKLTLVPEDTEPPTDKDYQILMEKGEGVRVTVQFEGEKYTDLLEVTSLGKASTSKGGIALGSFTGEDAEKTLTATLEIPLEAGNDIQKLVGHLGWVIRAEIIPDDSAPVTPGGPTGGDDGGNDDATSNPPQDVEIGDPDVPLADAPDEEVEDIEDEDVPLAALPQTGLLWWPVPVLLCAGGAFLIVGAVRRKKNEE